jgi:hypothetical protein
MKKRNRWWLLPLICVLMALAVTGLSALAEHYRREQFFIQNLTPAQQRVKSHADQMGISYWDYPASLIELLERNPETEAFVLNYPFRREDTSPLPDRSRGVPLFLQWDTRWGYSRYGSDFLAITGCGPTCLAMVGYYLTGDEAFTPDKVAAFSLDRGYYTPGSGSEWTLISRGGVELGLEVTEIPLVEKRIREPLAAGQPIICAMGPGDFTASGHYIVLVGLEDGLIRVNDPNSPLRSQTLWSYDRLRDQIRNLWLIEKRNDP